MNMSHRRRPDAREAGIVQRVRKSLRDLPVEHPHVLLACSGGKDSVALAAVLSQLQRLDLVSLSLAHIHHGQHSQADATMESVESIGKTLGVPVAIRNLGPSEIAAHTGVGLEEAMRRERYLALGEIAVDLGAEVIAVGHHQMDQAETVLLHLLRGSGVNGLAGMRAWEMRRIPWWVTSERGLEIGIWRPFLRESADEVADVSAAYGLPIVEDPTNTDTAYRRNAIRHRLLPVIEDIAPGSTAAIARAADLIAEDADLLDDLTRGHLATCLGGAGLSRSTLVSLPIALQRRVVRAWLLQALPNEEISFERFAAVVEIADRNRGGARVQIAGGYGVVLQNGLLILDPWQNNG